MTEQQIAEAATALIDRAETGGTAGQKLSRREQRIAGRTRATAPPAWQPEPEPEPEPGTVDSIEDETAVDDGPLAEVIPLGVFDARKEAETWW
ncbi:hypothetical protein AB0H83_39595 [Dactylosporangium sp. NPDC050688]|uniref:hypothetical protein n=1 Tax=Dactylosporangium sp. NPDC050688 TaxID=3157217 RepID=UPI0033FBE200